MSVAHDLDFIADEKRKEAARLLVREYSQVLYAFRRQGTLLEAGDLATWRQARNIALEITQKGSQLGLGLLVACAKEVLVFADRRLEASRVGMELERLQHDRDLK
jgi:hypothetical protein